MLKITGHFDVRILRDGVVIFEDSFSNGIVDEGKNDILDVMFNAASNSTWYCGIIDSITTLSDADTMSSHAGWTEFTNVDEANRQTWNPDAAASKQVINPSTAYVTYTIDDATDPTLDGIFICSDNTLGGTSGTLWSTAAFTTPAATLDNDVVEIQYSITIN